MRHFIRSIDLQVFAASNRITFSFSGEKFPNEEEQKNLAVCGREGMKRKFASIMNCPDSISSSPSKMTKMDDANNKSAVVDRVQRYSLYRIL